MVGVLSVMGGLSRTVPLTPSTRATRRAPVGQKRAHRGAGDQEVRAERSNGGVLSGHDHERSRVHEGPVRVHAAANTSIVSDQVIMNTEPFQAMLGRSIVGVANH